MKSDSSRGSARGLFVAGLLVAGLVLAFFLWNAGSSGPTAEGETAGLAASERGLSPIQSVPSTDANAPGDRTPSGRFRAESEDHLGFSGPDDQSSERTRASEGSRPGGPADDPFAESEEINRAIQRGLEIKQIEAGILAAQANPGPPPSIAQALAQPSSEVPVELERASRQADVTPPEILDALYAERSDPPEIIQAMQEAAERGTSDEMRAFMAGETDVRPPELGGPAR